MITEVKERKLTNVRDLNFNYDGRWVIFEGTLKPGFIRG